MVLHYELCKGTFLKLQKTFLQTFTDGGKLINSFLTLSVKLHLNYVIGWIISGSTKNSNLRIKN